MKRLITLIATAILLIGLVVLGLSCAPQATLEISVTEIDNDFMIENVGNVACLVFVSSPDGEEQFELAIGESVTVTDIAKPTEGSVVSSATG